MGLDYVELIMAVEEEFGIQIPDHKAEKLTTVDKAYDYLKRELKAMPPENCLRQKLFFKFRRALIDNYGIDRKDITLQSKLGDIVEIKDLKQGWPFLSLFSELDFPKFEVPTFLFKSKFNIENQTVGEVLTALMTVNSDKVPPEKDSSDDIWVRLVKVICAQLNADVKEVQPNTSFARDLGVD